MGQFESFTNPPRSARPMVRWWWPGADVEKDELVREVREMDEAGFLGAEIQVFMIGSPHNLARTDPARYRRAHRFMQPHYYEMVKAVLDEGARRGMTFDLTVCSSWPAAGTGVSPADSMQVLLMGAKALKGGRRYVGPVPRFKKPFFYNVANLLRLLGFVDVQTFYPDAMRLVRVVAARPTGKPGKVWSFSLRPTTAYLDVESAIDLTGQVSAQGILEWDAPQGAWQVFAFYAGPSGTHPLLDARENPDGKSLVLDHLAREPIVKYLEHHLGRAKPYFGEHFGRTLRAFFTDSLELSSEWIWTDDFLLEFEKRRGYDPAPYLPVGYIPARDNKYLTILVSEKRPCFDFEGDLGERIRHDMEQTVSDLFTERFTQAMTDWAEANGLLSRIQAYGVRADTLKIYGIAHVPETEQLFAGGVRDFLRLAGSAGVIYDKPLVAAESMVWNQRDYLTTPLKWKVAADRLFVSGINQMIYHGFPYQNPDFPYPGFDPFSSPYLPPKFIYFASNFSRANPFCEFFPAMNAYITRCQQVLQQGRTVCNVGLFYPLFNYPDAVLAEEEVVGGVLDEFDVPMAWRTSGGQLKDNLDDDDRWVQAQIGLADHLLAHGYSYVHVNPESLLRARVEDGKLVIGVARLDVFILSRVERVTVEVARKLQEIAEAGIPVVFVGQLADRQPGLYNYRENDAIVASVISGMAQRYGDALETDTGLASHLAAKPGVRPNLVFEQPQPSIHYIHKQMSEADYYFIRHARRDPITVSVRFPHPDCAPVFLDPWTGQAGAAAQYEVDGDAVRVDLAFSSYGSCIVAFCSADNAPRVLRGDLPVVREGGAIVARAAKAGDYVFTLNDDSHKSLRVEQDAPSALRLDSWRLDTELRDQIGSVKAVRLDLDELKDWRDVPALKYCSSKGVYSARVTIGERYVQHGLCVTLDLGRVHDVAVVEINGEELEPLLVYPFAVDVTRYLWAGENEIRVVVTPTLRNRLLGYGKTGGKDWKQFKGRKEFAPSGLVGPVHLVPQWRIEVG